ncbi:hypothetical protein MON38_17200 [Hymenobacter sp. DH14]|uniref:Uncharacterized protein n=1 Tax=Hymenobacter cyanobacteriorum TaxID=2926463 RepID=A0A9X1VI79_9BACT|nr:hypothetical protein [Hymenobacter cyanobacteriorum]MCI1189163.1 hypothetical protein [Hymenobacter cyanobacteriorum]
MEKQFHLTLTNRWKATGLALAFVAATVLLLVGSATLLAHWFWLGVPMGLAVMAGLVFLPEIIMRKLATDFAVVTIDEAGLTVQYGERETSRRINFADIATYYTDLGDDFNVRLHHGPKLVLHLNHKIHPQGWMPLLAMQRHFEMAVAEYQRQRPENLPIRKLGFFNRPLATVWLVVFAVLVGWLGWRAWQPFASEGAWGGFLLTGLLFTIYTLMWQHERRKLSS